MIKRALESHATPWIVLALGIVATLVLWRNVAAVEHERASDRLRSDTRSIEREIDHQLQAYVQLLRGAEGLFAASVQVDRGEWDTYVSRLDLKGSYPLLSGLGYVPRAAAEEVGDYENAGVTIRPGGVRDEYYPIVYISATDGRFLHAIGFDLATDPARRAAMNRARDTGQPATSGLLEPIVAPDGASQKVIALFIPLYRHGAPTDTVEARRAALSGFVTGRFRIEAFMRGVVDEDDMRLLNLRLYDGESFETSKLLADSAPALGPGERGDLSTYATFAVPGRQWTLRVDSESAHLLPSSRAAATLAIGVLFDLLLFLLVGGQVRLKQKARLLAQKTTAELERSRDELAASLAEKDVLLAEVHHRVKNNLQVISSLIQMQARRVGDKAVAAALTECRGRVNAIALIHEKLYEEKDVGKLGFGSYVRSLVDGIVRATHAPTQLVRLDVSVPDLHVAVERAIPCGLLLNELVTNALEHAFPDGRPGTLRVELREEAGGRVVLGVSDDGIGLPADLEPAQSPSLGLRLVSALTSQLKAKLNVERRAGGGTKFELVLASA